VLWVETGGSVNCAANCRDAWEADLAMRCEIHDFCMARKRIEDRRF